MARLKLKNKQFQNIITALVDEIREAQKCVFYEVESNGKDKVSLIPEGKCFFATYIDRFIAMARLYHISLWFEVKNGKPCLVMFNN